MVAVVAGATAAVPGGARLPVPRPTQIKAENTQAGNANWGTPETGPRPIEGYASEPSVLPGEALHLHVSTAPAAPYRVEVYRLGWYGDKGGRMIECVPGCDGFEQGTARPHPAPDPVTGEVRAGWPVTDTLQVGRSWTSGYYDARLVLAGGGQASCVLFVVREPPSQRSQILVVASVNTWEAYNGWGGKSLYPESSDGGAAANHVSFDRPWAPGSEGQFFQWGLHLVRFLERGGYDVSYTTDVDVDRDPRELLEHKLVIVNGHNEYWTKGMRDAYENARDAGVNLVFMGANNGYWQIRYENDRRTIVEYRSKSADPSPDPAQKTTLFRALDPPRYECALEGVQHQGALERGNGPAHDFTVVPRALGDRWFAGTRFTATSTLPGLVGPEWDQVVSPKLAWTCAFTSMTVFFHYGGDPGNADAVRIVADSGARIFSAGSLQFVWGLDDYRTGAAGHADPRLQRFMQNVLADLTGTRRSGSLGGPYTSGRG